MMAFETQEVATGDLCYLSASKVDSPIGTLSQLELKTSEDTKLGKLSGVLIDPVARRIRYYAVQADRWFRQTCYLLPADDLAQVEADGRTLRLRISRQQVKRCPQLDTETVRTFSDDDLLTMMFRSSAASRPAF